MSKLNWLLEQLLLEAYTEEDAKKYNKNIRPEVIGKVVSSFRQEGTTALNPKARFVFNIINAGKDDFLGPLFLPSKREEEHDNLKWKRDEREKAFKLLKRIIGMVKYIPFGTVKQADDFISLQKAYEDFKKEKANPPKKKERNFLDLVPGVKFRVLKDAIFYYPQTHEKMKSLSMRMANYDTEGVNENHWCVSADNPSHFDSYKDYKDARFIVFALRNKQGEVDWDKRYMFANTMEDGGDYDNEGEPEEGTELADKKNNHLNVEDLPVSGETKKLLYKYRIYSSPTKMTKGKLYKSKGNVVSKKQLAVSEKPYNNLNNEDWEGGTWNDGKFNVGTWHKGTWKAGEWHDGRWKNGNWMEGTWRKGVWENGTWWDGIWYDGEWKNGTWKDGRWDKGTFHNGNIEDIDWYNGDFLDGEFNGNWYNGNFKGGDFYGDDWFNGIFKGGIWHDGWWWAGTWEGGTWNDGLIYDPNKDGNFKPDWKWGGDRGRFIRSPISPKEYWKGKEHLAIKNKDIKHT